MKKLTEEQIETMDANLEYIADYEEYVSDLSWSQDDDGVVTIHYSYYEGHAEDCDCEECFDEPQYNEDDIDHETVTISTEKELKEFEDSPRNYI